MRRFRFNLQKVLDYREVVEDKLMAELAAIQAEHDRESARLHDLVRARNRFRDHMRARLADGSPEEIKQAYSYLSDLADCLRNQVAVVRRLTDMRDGKLAEVLEASKDRKMLEKLRDRRREEHRVEADHQEQKFLDDVAGIHHSREETKVKLTSGENHVNLEHVLAARARVEEIRRRFVVPEDGRMADGESVGGAGFGDVLNRSRRLSSTVCPEELEPLISRAGERHGVDPAVIKAVISAESGFRSDAVSGAGARGLMQLMPGTARALGVAADDPAQNIEGGTRYLKQQLDRFGSLEMALAAYNAGPGAVTRYGGVPPYAETRRYVSQVLSSIASYSEGD